MVEIGEKVPKVVLVDTELQATNLKKEIKGKAAILAFFPGAFTGVCTAELCKFRDSMAEFNSMNGTVYAISVDGPFANKGFKEKNNLNFAILSDYRRKAVKKFGVVLENFAHLDGYTAAKRAVFVTDKKGIVRYKWVSDDPTVEPNYTEIKSALGAMS
ncbi:MAG TPA: redoxin domain-containing protein [Candidatus Saccharimonadales bacterium]|nr:redoxin domain-containing protein [Candidatus Saccharimonadales bacterium]